MPCYRPLKAYRGHGGTVEFDSKRGFSDRPLELACGQCIGCRWTRAREWALRCVHEASLHERNCFVTLTYSDAELPRGGSLDVEDWKKFAKRVRRKCGPYRYLHCGEYGPSTLRPHYHAAVFGLDFTMDPDRVLLKRKPHPLWASPVLAERWGHGQCSVGELTFESAAYVARYVVKKATGELAAERYERVDESTGEVFQVRPEYATMSRRPGLGKGWFERFRDDVYPADEVIHAGRSYRPPRFYDELLPEEEREEYKKRRREKVGERSEELNAARLEQREEWMRARLSRLSRDGV